MQEMLPNIKNNKMKFLLCILSIFTIELAPLLLFIDITDEEKFVQIIFIVLFLFTGIKNFIFIFLYIFKNNFIYTILEKALAKIKFRLLLLVVFLLFDVFFNIFNTYIFKINGQKSLTLESSIYLGLLPIYALFLLIFLKKTYINHSLFWTNLIFILEKTFYLLMGLATIFPILALLLFDVIFSGLGF